MPLNVLSGVSYSCLSQSLSFFLCISFPVWFSLPLSHTRPGSHWGLGGILENASCPLLYLQKTVKSAMNSHMDVELEREKEEEEGDEERVVLS